MSENISHSLNTLDALNRFFERYVNLSEKLNHSPPRLDWDDQWLSPCIENPIPDERNQVVWRPTRRLPAENIFASLEKGLDVTFHEDILCYYNSFWSDGFVATHDIGEISLIQLWNEDDEEMLKENLLGHAFAKKKSRLPLTIFIGSTEDEQVICIDNDSGHVVIEKPGFEAHKTIANNIREFIDALTPSLKPYG